MYQCPQTYHFQNMLVLEPQCWSQASARKAKQVAVPWWLYLSEAGRKKI